MQDNWKFFHENSLGEPLKMPLPDYHNSPEAANLICICNASRNTRILCGINASRKAHIVFASGPKADVNKNRRILSANFGSASVFVSFPWSLRC